MQFSITTALTTVLVASSSASALAIRLPQLSRDVTVSCQVKARNTSPNFPPFLKANANFTQSSSDTQVQGKRSNDGSADIQKREILTAIVTTAGTAVVVDLTTRAVNAATALVKDISNWDKARQDFTQATAKAMMDNNPDATKYVAAACYNKDYSVSNPENTDGKTSVSFKLGALSTNYDCLYMKAPNTFYTHGDGGYQNLAYRNTNACTFDQSTGDLACK
ncbi:hypothetical protein PG993_009864 [Apiospora rasikravindrae]|uniref:DUF7888 domain-containing protein n=1 Tax=Apiospora rasikravindrae TaxID=990691 RepID=A0ABR1SKS3_9PEZI